MKIGCDLQGQSPMAWRQMWALTFPWKASKQLSYKTDLCLKMPLWVLVGSSLKRQKPPKDVSMVIPSGRERRDRETPLRGTAGEESSGLAGWGTETPRDQEASPNPLHSAGGSPEEGHRGAWVTAGPEPTYSPRGPSLYSAVALPSLHSHPHTILLLK